MTEVAFLLVAAVLIPASLLVVAAPNLFHGALALALALVGTAVLYLLLAAEFLALIQVLLYAGGVVTLVVFAITVTGRLGGGPELGIARGRLAGLAVSVGLFALLADQFLRAGLPVGWAKAPAEPTRALAESLVTTYLLPFEALSALLLVAMVAAIILARRDDETAEANGSGAGGRVGEPAEPVSPPRRLIGAPAKPDASGGDREGVANEQHGGGAPMGAPLHPWDTGRLGAHGAEES